MSGLHVTIRTPPLFAGDLIGFTTGLLLTVLLLVLTIRALKLPGTPLVNIGFALCALLWCAGGLGQAACVVAGIERASRWMSIAQALQLTGEAAFPIPVLAVWRPYAKRQVAARVLLVGACVSAGVIAMLVWTAPVLGVAAAQYGVMRLFTTYNASLFLAVGSLVSLRRADTPRVMYVPSMVIVAAVCGATLCMLMLQHSPEHIGFGGLGAHLILIVVLCAFFLFARFRFADVFIRYGVRIVLAGTWAAVLTFVTHSDHLWQWARNARSPYAVHVFLILMVANTLLLSFTFADERISARVKRWLFRAPDYRAEVRRLSNRLARLEAEAEISKAVEEAAREPLQLAGVKLAPIELRPMAEWPAALAEGEIVELDYRHPLRQALPLANAELLAPIVSGGRVTHVLLVAPGATRPGLVTDDWNYLRAIAAQCGNRLEALRREREAVERESREALLQQQVTEAELRALRAQINPHFLFNSLNTIADLMVRDVARAEAMTLRLASVFRHVLAHSSRSLTSIREEIEFLRTYLYIEEARFGERLQVEIELAPEVAGELIPSLILQPLVENALKHGLGPKIGQGHLRISAEADGEQVRLKVEDDGVGPAPKWAAEPNGKTESQSHGLTNVAARLNTLYRDRASVKMEPREAGGIAVTVSIPRSSVKRV